MCKAFRLLAVVIALLASTGTHAFNVQLFQGVDDPRGWRPGEPIPYSINLGAWDNDPARDALIAGIRSAYAEVENNPHIDVQFDYLGTTSTLPATDNQSIVHLASNLGSFGVTRNYRRDSENYITSVDIQILGSSYVSSPAVALKAITLHELHHFLGLSHSVTGRDSTVFAGNAITSMSADDVAGLAALYPSATNPLSDVTATLTGRVLRLDGSPMRTLVGHVVVYERGTDQPRRITNSAYDLAGNFELVGLPPGTYEVFFESASATNKREHLYFDSGATLTVAAGQTYSLPELQIPSAGFPNLADGVYRDAIPHPFTGLLYAYLEGRGRIQVTDPVTGDVLDTITTTAQSMAFSEDGRRLFAVNVSTSEMSVFDVDPSSPGYHEQLDTVTVAGAPFSVKVAPNQLVYVASIEGESLSAYNADTLALVERIDLGEEPWGVELSKSGLVAFIGTRSESILKVDIDPSSRTYHQVIARQPTQASAAYAIQEGIDGNNLFQGTRSGLSVRDADTFEETSRIDTGALAVRFATSKSGRYLAFAGIDDIALRNAQLWIVDTRTAEVAEKILLAGNYIYVNPGEAPNEFIVTGDSGLIRINIDADSDGLLDTSDPDDDNDGVEDTSDALPLDPNESADRDGDGVGDNTDAFPDDATESSDTDGDGIGDNADAFPIDPLRTGDADGDGFDDNFDMFPNDNREYIDIDGNGVGDSAVLFNDLALTQGIDLEPETDRPVVYVGLSNIGRINKIDLNTQSVVDFYEIEGRDLHYIANNSSLVAREDETLRFIDTNEVSTTYGDVVDTLAIPTEFGATQRFLSTRDHRGFALTANNELHVFDLLARQFVTTRSVDIQGIRFAQLSQDELSLYVVMQLLTGGTIIVTIDIDPASATYLTIVNRAEGLPLNVAQAAFDAAQQKVYLTRNEDIVVLDLTTFDVLTQIPLAQPSSPLLLDNGNLLATVTRIQTSPRAYQMTFINTATYELVERITVPMDQPIGLYPSPIDPQRQLLAMANFVFFFATVTPYSLNPDDDGDGVADEVDAFPFNSTESADSDLDGIGDNADAFPNDTDNDGLSNDTDEDDDGDNTVDSLDAFPLDPSEQLDSDNDGIGNNADRDDDGDGIIDSRDAAPNSAIIDNALLIPLDGTLIRGNLANGEDVNYFRIVIRAGRHYEVTTSLLTAGLQTSLQARSNGDVLAQDTTSGNASVLDYQAINDGVLDVRVSTRGAIGGRYAISVIEYFDGPPAATSLVAALLPASRSVEVGQAATAFVTVLNAGNTRAEGCNISPETSLPVSFAFRATDSATNATTDDPFVPQSLDPGAAQTFVIEVTPYAPMPPSVVPFRYLCDNSTPADLIVGVNSLLLSASAAPTPDVVALAATLSNDGVARADTGSVAFAVATVNVGSAETITVSADTGTAELPLQISLCQTDPATGACIAPEAPSADPVTTTIANGETPTFAFFIGMLADVPFDPARSRVFVRFRDSDGEVRGSTSVAVTGVLGALPPTPPPATSNSLSLTFDRSIVDSLQDGAGNGTGLTHRLPGTGGALGVTDTNLQLLPSPGHLRITSTKADLNGQANLPGAEFPGVRLADYGFTGSEDFAVRAVFNNIDYRGAFDQFGLYLGSSSSNNFRAGYLHFGGTQATLFSVHNQSGFDNNLHTILPGPAQGSQLVVTLSRTSGAYDLRFNGVRASVLSPSYLDTEADLYVGVFAGNPGNDIAKVTELDEFFVEVFQ